MQLAVCDEELQPRRLFLGSCSWSCEILVIFSSRQLRARSDLLRYPHRAAKSHCGYSDKLSAANDVTLTDAYLSIRIQPCQTLRTISR